MEALGQIKGFPLVKDSITTGDQQPSLRLVILNKALQSAATIKKLRNIKYVDQ